MSKSLTPEHLRCSLAMSCPSIHRMDDGRLLIVGEQQHYSWIKENGGNPSLSEAGILISEDLLSDLIAEKTSTLQHEVERLKIALEPFAEVADSYDPEEEGDGPTAAWAHDFTLASLRRARAALNPKQEETV